MNCLTRIIVYSLSDEFTSVKVEKWGIKVVFIHENETSAKADNFAFKNSNIIISHLKNLKHKKIILLINFIFDTTFFLIAYDQILKNYAILINHESFFQRKDFPQLHRCWFSKINSLMAGTIRKHFPRRNFYKQIAENSPSIIILLFLKA